MLEAVSTGKTQDIRAPVPVQPSQIQGSVPKKIISDTNTQDSRSQPKRQATQSELEDIAKAMDKYANSHQRDLKIQVHKGTGTIMVKVISKENGKVIREIPAEEILNLAEKMESMVGGLVDRNA